MVFLQSQDYWIFDHFFVSLFHHFDYYGCEKVTNHVCQCWYSRDCNQTWSLRWEIDQRPILLVKDSTLPKTNKWSNKIPQHTQVHVLHHLGDSTLKKWWFYSYKIRIRIENAFEKKFQCIGMMSNARPWSLKFCISQLLECLKVVLLIVTSYWQNLRLMRNKI